MKFFRILFIILTVLTVKVIYSQYGWFGVTSGTTQDLNGVSAVNSTACAVGKNGLILRSANRGANWITQTSGTASSLNDVLLNRSGAGYIVGDNGVILTSTNYGADWVLRSSGVTARLNAIYWLYDTVSVIAVGDGGMILRSVNMGITWQQVNSPLTVNLNDIISTPHSEIIVVGDGGKILLSGDLGYMWSVIPSGTVNNLNCLAMQNYFPFTADAYAAGDNGTILKSSDYGFSWVSQNSGTTANLLSMTGYPAMWDSLFYIIAAGTGGTIIESVNGNGWQQRNINISQDLNSIFLEDLNYGFAGGNGGAILKSIGSYVYIDSKALDANTISALFNNNGSFNIRRDTVSSSGFEWPKASGKFARYASGLWLGAFVNGQLRVTTGHYDSEYYPGYTDNTLTPHGKNDSVYRIYKIIHGTPGTDRAYWPNSLLGNSDQGAPVYYDTVSGSWKALDLGSQTMFSSMTDSYAESHINGWGGKSLPLNADIKQLNFSLNTAGPLGNTIFTQYSIINRSNTIWHDAYITVWSDDDLGDGTDDLIGCDSALSMGYTYNGTNLDAVYGSAPPAVGFIMLRGVHKFTGNSFDTVKYCLNRSRVIKNNFKDIGLSAFQFSINGDPYYHDPLNTQESYWLMQGLYADGTTMHNTAGGYATTFAYTGDPVTSQGWIPEYFNDFRMFLSTGPVDMNPGDTQVIVIAQVIAKGNDNLNSITALRTYVNEVRTFYNSCYTSTPIGITGQNEVVRSYKLHQNYPNPFNPLTTISYDIPKSGIVTIRVYDILGKLVFASGEFKTAGNHSVVFDGTGFASGLYFYSIEAGDFKETKKMVLVK